MRGRSRESRGRGNGIGLHLEEIIGVDFDNVDIIFLSYAIDGLVTRCALGSAGRILTYGNSVEKPGVGCVIGVVVPS